MFKYIGRRLIQAIPTLFGISILSFLIISAAPGGPTAALMEDPKLKTAEQRKLVAQQLGLDDPWPFQYLRWLIGDDWRQFDDGNGGTRPGTHFGIIRGDFGYSFINHRSVISLIAERAPATLELGVSAFLIELSLGVPIGIIAAVRQGSWFDNLTRVMSVIFTAVPIFWLGLILILIFGVWLGIPAMMGSRCPTALFGCPPLYERLDHLILPALVLAAGGIAGYSRYLRASMLDVVGQDYIRTAQAKGLEPRTVWFVHGARNALIPLATFLGPALTGLLGGAVVTETIFSWPGLGRLAIDALSSYDYPLIMALTIFGAITTVFGFILSDVLYALIDPRIRFS